MIKREQTSVRIVRRFSVPPEKVWQGWTDPTLIRRWFGSDPNGTVSMAKLDLRPGGRFEITFANADQAEHTCSGVYAEVLPYTKLSFSWRWKSEPNAESFATVLLAREGDKTRMHFRHAQLGRESLHDYGSGWRGAFAKLERELGTENLRSKSWEVSQKPTLPTVEPFDDELKHFAEQGALPLPMADLQGYLNHDGVRIWHASFGAGSPVILLHGGMGHSGNWGFQVPSLVGAGFQVILIDSRGHGRSTRDARPYSYELMAADVLAVMDALQVARAVVIGWSDGACTGLVLARKCPDRVAGVFFFGCNMDPSGTKALDESNPLLGRCFGRHMKDYARLSPTPGEFKLVAEAVGLMQRTQPNYDPFQADVPPDLVADLIESEEC